MVTQTSRVYTNLIVLQEHCTVVFIVYLCLEQCLETGNLFGADVHKDGVRFQHSAIVIMDHAEIGIHGNSKCSIFTCRTSYGYKTCCGIIVSSLGSSVFTLHSTLQFGNTATGQQVFCVIKCPYRNGINHRFLLNFTLSNTTQLSYMGILERHIPVADFGYIVQHFLTVIVTEEQYILGQRPYIFACAGALTYLLTINIYACIVVADNHYNAVPLVLCQRTVISQTGSIHTHLSVLDEN